MNEWNKDQCNKCGNIIESDWYYCSRCGYLLRKDEDLVL
jgi:tRNA(Ile2) C34 agmatinyltransferase TiaS